MRRRNLLRVLALLLAAALGAASVAPTSAAPAQTTEITVFAAASLTDAFRQIGKSFEKANPGVKVTFNFAGSQQLAAQLGQGAPADVFASANAAQMKVAADSGRIAAGASKPFVLNRLVVVVSPGSRAKVTRLQDLATPGVKVILAAKAVPVGQYALDFLDKAAKDSAYGASFKAGVLANVVSYEDNVRSVLTKVALGEGDAGVVYVSDVVASPKTPVRRLDIPTAFNVIASYPVAPVSDSKHPELAAKFVRYLFAGDSRLTLARYGFSLP